jgi:hypothetical protein
MSMKSNGFRLSPILLAEQEFIARFTTSVDIPVPEMIVPQCIVRTHTLHGG